MKYFSDRDRLSGPYGTGPKQLFLSSLRHNKLRDKMMKKIQIIVKLFYKNKEVN